MSRRERVAHLIEGLSDEDLAVVERMLRGLSIPEETAPPPVSPVARRARARAGYGSMAHLPGTVDESLREKHEDIEREEERHRRKHPEEA